MDDLGSFYIRLQARLKIGTHLLSNRSPDGFKVVPQEKMLEFVKNFKKNLYCFLKEQGACFMPDKNFFVKSL